MRKVYEKKQVLQKDGWHILLVNKIIVAAYSPHIGYMRTCGKCDTRTIEYIKQFINSQSYRFVPQEVLDSLNDSLNTA